MPTYQPTVPACVISPIAVIVVIATCQSASSIQLVYVNNILENSVIYCLSYTHFHFSPFLVLVPALTTINSLPVLLGQYLNMKTLIVCLCFMFYSHEISTEQNKKKFSQAVVAFGFHSSLPVMGDWPSSSPTSTTRATSSCSPVSVSYSGSSWSTSPK